MGTPKETWQSKDKKKLMSCDINFFYCINVSYPKNDNKIPAATAEPITPATLGPMACISKKFEGFAS